MALKKFLDDWSEYTEKQILENVAYLNRWLRFYKLDSSDSNVKIGNVEIRCGRFNANSGDNDMYYEIGHRIFREDSDVGMKIKRLYWRVVEVNRTLKDRFNFWWKEHKEFVKVSKQDLLTICIVGVVGFYIGQCYDTTEEIIDNKIQDREQAYPGYTKAREEMQHYSDSVHRNTPWVWWPWGKEK